MLKRQALVLSVCALFFVSCKTTPKAEEIARPIRIESHFPSPYDESGNALVTLEGETVKMPLWYWLKICDYVIDVETNMEISE